MMLPLAACNSQTIDPAVKKAGLERSAEIAKKSRVEGYKAVKAILDVYVSNLPGKLEGFVSNNYMPSKQEFINHVEQNALDKTITNIEVIVDNATFVQGIFAVNFDWNRSYMPKGSASQTIDSGTTNFVFVKEADGWRLMQINGSDIF